MKRVTEKINITVIERIKKEYSIEGLTVTDEQGNETTFQSIPKMAEFLGITKAGLYSKIDKELINKELERLRK